MRILIILCLLNPFCAYASEKHWMVSQERSMDFYLTTVVEDGHLTAHTRENALKEIAGTFMYYAAKAVSPIKNPEIIRIEASRDDEGSFKGAIEQFTSSKSCVCSFDDGRLKISILDEAGEIDSEMEGVPVEMIRPVRDYSETIMKILSVAEGNFFDPEASDEKEWKKFKKKLQKAAKNLVDDYELQITAAFLSSKLDAPMVLLNDSITQAFWGEKLDESDDERQVSLKRLDDQSVVLSIRNFTHQAGIETGEAIDEIARNEYANLFIDLRGARGTIPSAMLQISEYIIEEPLVVGFAPNRKWYAANEGPPTLKDVDEFNTFTEGSFRKFIDSAAQGNGQILKISPSEHSFQGRVFLLINENTQGLAEMIIAGLKRENVAVIAGESSAGSMRLLRPLRIGPDLELLLSANDFVNLEGESIRSSPIEPHVEVDLDEDYAFVAALLEER